jgi:signal transduction histidine kinase
MSSGIMLIDMNGAVTLINEVGAGILRSRRDDVINRRLTDLFPETSAFVKSSVGPYQEIDVRLSDRSVVPIGFSSTCYRGISGEQEGVIVLFRDLSEIKALRSELLNKERFAAMGRVVAGAAHEIRNPLFGISSVGQILERELDNPAHRELVRALLSETKRLNQLVEELLLYGKPMVLRPKDCDVAAVCKEVLDMHRDELKRLEIGISTDLHVKPIPAYLDANQVRQVFLNLFRNAIDATPPGGTLTVRLLLEDRYIIVTIADTGIGIPEDNRDKIFDLFFTTKPKGTGLGLAICKKIVQDHGGEIAVESADGKGTTVTVKLPYRGMAVRASAH